MGSGQLTRWPLARLLAGGAAAGLVAALAPATPAAAATECSVDYEITNEWGSGFTANVTVNNEGDPVSDWVLGWTFPDGQQVSNGWSGDFSQDGDQVTVTHPGWQPDLGSGESATVGFQATADGANGEPQEFTLNGTVCGGGGGAPENTPPDVSLTSPEDGATFLAGEDIELAAEASDSDGSVEQVVFEADGTEIGTDGSAPYTATWSGAETGPYSVTATAVDDAGAETSSSPVAVEVIDEPEIVAAPSGVSVRQGGEATFDVSLSNAPDSAVDVSVARSEGSEDLSVSSGAELTFTADDWDTDQEVTVSSADNGGSLASAVFTASGQGYGSATVEVTEIDAATSDYEAAFLEQYEKIKDPASGYFREFDGGLVPYH